MKKMQTTAQTGKLKLGKETITRLNDLNLQLIQGGLRRLGATDSVCGTACCDTDHYTNCKSISNVCF